ncbi:MAG TPA: hypothetical protein VLM18_06700 [Croceibacterium sp.]|nr:hypothetical protein [Croceibacterium sp.]
MSELHPLADAVSHPSPGKREVPLWRMLAGVLLAPSAFSLQVVTSYVIAANGCAAGSSPSGWLAAINLLAFAAVVAGMGIAIANFRATQSEKQGGQKRAQEVCEGRSRFIAFCGLCASAIFGLAVIVQLTAILTLSSCVGFASFN